MEGGLFFKVNVKVNEIFRKLSKIGADEAGFLNCSKSYHLQKSQS